MTGWLIVADRKAHPKLADLPYQIMTPREYVASRLGDRNGERMTATARRLAPKVLNLSRAVGYQEIGYYCSLLAEARGHRVLPSVTTILELSRRSHYAHSLPDLEDSLNKHLRRMIEPPDRSFHLLILFGTVDDPRFARFARLVFDWFRAPVLRLWLRQGEWWTVQKIDMPTVDRLSIADADRFQTALLGYTAKRWQSPKLRKDLPWTLGVLYDPKEAMPPTHRNSLVHMTRVAEQMGVAVRLLGKRDIDRVGELDGLFIRETTKIGHHSYRFALRAEQEGIPVIDCPRSILRCTNKVFLAELLTANKVPTPATRPVGGMKDLYLASDELGLPLVLKLPDGAFSRGVFKANDRAELERIGRKLFDESDLIVAQEFMYTEFDWRIGVLDGKPLFASQYMMARKHWQIVRHGSDGRADEGGFRTVAIEDAPAAVVDIGVKAARLIGNGLYGVDLKETARGIFVIEINDNPNVDHHIEGVVLGDEIWRRIIGWFLARFPGARTVTMGV